ncbi:MAG: hypothetical protein O2910_08455, partial [Proteobacteria bacterium]|nr:hypothetical protein [Pseudomonadota bacterium]
MKTSITVTRPSFALRVGRALTVVGFAGFLLGAEAEVPISGEKAVFMGGTYIVQGIQSQAVKQAVLDTGAAVSHELPLIKAVGAKLTRTQYQRLLTNPAVSHIHANQAVETSVKPTSNGNGGSADSADSDSVRGNPDLSFDSTVGWLIGNVGDTDLTIKQIDITWPAQNGGLLAVDYDRYEIHQDNLDGTNAVVYPAPSTGNKIRKNSSGELRFSFSSAPTEDAEGYSINVIFNEGPMVEYTPGQGMPVQVKGNRQTFYPELINADALHLEGTTGDGVTIAVVDSGLWKNKALSENTRRESRIKAYYDANLD